MKKKEVTLNDIVQRDPEMVYSTIDDEVVMLSIQNSEYYGLNPVGSRIWGLLENKKKVNELISELLNEFESEPEICTRETLGFLNDMNKKGLLVFYNEE